MSRPLLRVEGLTAGWREPVVGPLSFTIEPGEVVGLWGPNGCGKSTLLHALADGARIFAGSVTRAPGLSLGFAEQRPQRPAQVPMTGRELLAFIGARRPPPERLAAWLDRRVDRLSGGQYQLLAVWAVLGGDSDLVLLDEPTNNLDPAGETILADLLAGQQCHRGALVVSHERGFLGRACSRVIALGAGAQPQMNVNERK